MSDSPVSPPAVAAAAEQEHTTSKLYNPDLPIHAHKHKILQLVRGHQIVVITGETGSGKSTQLAQYLYEAGYGQEGTIAITQPRRIGAVSVSKRVAEEMGCELGAEVGYTIRFEDLTSPKTKIRFMTDGCLLRECLAHDALQPYSVIVMDEAHERSLQTDILFGILRQITRARPDLKVIITSATLQTAKFSTYFHDCPTYHVEGRCFPVEVINIPKVGVHASVRARVTACSFVFVPVCIYASGRVAV